MLIIPSRTVEQWQEYGVLDRREVEAGAGGSVIQGNHLLARQAPSSSGTPTSSSTDTSTPSPFPNQGWAFGGSKSQILNWAAIAVVVGLMLVIAGWRLATIRDRSFRSFFFPRGLRIKWLGIDIKPPPPPPPRPTISDLEQQRRARRAEERFQRRRTRGDNIGEGGQRQDEAGDDDDWSVWEEGTGRRRAADRESLPGYKADISAPVYLEEWRVQAEQEGHLPAIDPATEEAIRQSGPVVESSSNTTNPEGSGTSPSDQQDTVMSVAEYEARQRGDTYPPIAAAATTAAGVSAAHRRIAEGLERTHARTEAEEDEEEEEEERAHGQTTAQHASNAHNATTASGHHTLANRVVGALRRPEPARTNSMRSVRSGPPLYDNLSRVPSRTE